ncbi:MAG TPA: ImmA/IrrE family metallo-endopeptidase [Phycisphaerae bacterium]|nr:ImmA/IrrE family metallo-endopeptidase [Phycisphaerae bacterium]
MRPAVSRQLVAPDRRIEIAELAEAVADEHCPSLPVDPLAIARANRITHSFGPYGEAFDGMLEHKDGRFHIFCNLDRLARPDAPRARFTLAHELGHYYIDEHRHALAAGRAAAHRSACEYESPILAEQEADLFAANLLMPAGRFGARARAAAPGLDGVLALAAAFGTSVTATAIRYAAADVRPCAVIKWNWSGYAWKWLSSSVFQARLTRTFEAARDLTEDSPTRKALAREEPPDPGYFQAGTTAAAWFPRVAGGDWRDAILVEQAIPLGKFGVLTFLHAAGRLGG